MLASRSSPHGAAIWPRPRPPFPLLPGADRRATLVAGPRRAATRSSPSAVVAPLLVCAASTASRAVGSPSGGCSHLVRAYSDVPTESGKAPRRHDSGLLLSRFSQAHPRSLLNHLDFDLTDPAAAADDAGSWVAGLVEIDHVGSAATADSTRYVDHSGAFDSSLEHVTTFDESAQVVGDAGQCFDPAGIAPAPAFLDHLPDWFDCDATHLDLLAQGATAEAAPDCDPSGSGTTTARSTSRDPDTRHQHADGRSCQVLAHEILESLSFRQYRKATAAEPSGADPEVHSPTAEQVLQETNDAMDGLQNLFGCHCARSPHLAMLYASLLSKILTCYQQAAGCKRSRGWSLSAPASIPSPPPSSSVSQSSSLVSQPGANNHTSSARPRTPTLSESTGFAIEPLQVSVGAFRVREESVQELIRTQLILGELGKLGTLIECFRNLGSRNGSSGSMDDLYSSLDLWLTGELSRTVSILKAGLFR